MKINPHIKITHCSAYRVALVSEQSSNTVKNIQEYGQIVKDICKFVKTGNQSDLQEEIQKVLDDPVVRIKEIHAERWFSFFLALNSLPIFGQPNNSI